MSTLTREARTRRYSPTLSTPLRVGPLSWLVPMRAGIAVLGSLVALAVLVALDLSMGDFEIPISDVVRTLLGGGDAGQQFIVMECACRRHWSRS